MIRAAVRTETAQFATTIEEDIALLESEGTPYWMRVTVLFRVRFKRILDTMLKKPDSEKFDVSEGSDFEDAEWTPETEGQSGLKANSMYAIEIDV